MKIQSYLVAAMGLTLLCGCSVASLISQESARDSESGLVWRSPRVGKTQGKNWISPNGEVSIPLPNSILNDATLKTSENPQEPGGYTLYFFDYLIGMRKVECHSVVPGNFDDGLNSDSAGMLFAIDIATAIDKHIKGVKLLSSRRVPEKGLIVFTLLVPGASGVTNNGKAQDGYIAFAARRIGNFFYMVSCENNLILSRENAKQQEQLLQQESNAIELASGIVQLKNTDK